MISLSPVVVLGFLELLLLLAALTGWLAWKVRQQDAAPASEDDAEAATSGPRPHGVRLDVGNYLAEELEQTRARLHNPVPDAGAPSPAFALRADYLQLEKDFAAHEHRDEQAWGPFEERLSKLLEQLVPKHPDLPPTPPDSREGRQLQELLSNQMTHIDDLHGFLKDVVVHPEKAEELEKRIERMNRVNQELAGCVAVLEGENDRLWRQIEAVHPEHGAPAASPDAEGAETKPSVSPSPDDREAAPAAGGQPAPPTAPAADPAADPAATPATGPATDPETGAAALPPTPPKSSF